MTPEQQSIKSINMKEPIEQIKEWLNRNIKYEISPSEVLEKIAEFEEAYNNAFIDKLIEEGRIAESITHNAKSECFNNATCETMPTWEEMFGSQETTPTEPQEVWMKCIATVEELNDICIYYADAVVISGKIFLVRTNPSEFIHYSIFIHGRWFFSIPEMYFIPATPEEINTAKEKPYGL